MRRSTALHIRITSRALQKYLKYKEPDTNTGKKTQNACQKMAHLHISFDKSAINNGSTEIN